MKVAWSQFHMPEQSTDGKVTGAKEVQVSEVSKVSAWWEDDGEILDLMAATLLQNSLKNSLQSDLV